LWSVPAADFSALYLQIGEANDAGHQFGIGTEWLRGEKLCTFSGKFHLAWSVPMADVTYYT